MFIQNRGLGIISHARRPKLVDDPSTFGDSVGQVPRRRSITPKGPSPSLNDRTKGFLHVFRHLDLIVAPCEMEAQNRNAPFVAHLWIDLAVAIGIRNHLPTAGKSDVGAIVAATFLLQRRTVTFV